MEEKEDEQEEEEEILTRKRKIGPNRSEHVPKPPITCENLQSIGSNKEALAPENPRTFVVSDSSLR